VEQLADLPFEIARHVLFATAGASVPNTAALVSHRRKLLRANLNLSYSEPLHIVRGWKQYLYDADGREFLDA
jgi:4-aminobutyrate aminotransferase-like enzyme